MWALCVVEDYVVVHHLPELGYGTVIPPVQFLPFQTGKEGFCHGVVVGTACAGEGLFHIVLYNTAQKRSHHSPISVHGFLGAALFVILLLLFENLAYGIGFSIMWTTSQLCWKAV